MDLARSTWFLIYTIVTSEKVKKVLKFLRDWCEVGA